MTLHLVLLSRKYILHASDRLVTLNTGEIHDPLANKNLVYQARDAIVSIGYTGLAYGLSPNNNTPTDEWLAEILWGEPFLRGPDGRRPATSRMRPPIGNWLDIWQALDLICSELQNSMNRIPPKRKTPGFEVIIAGWQRTRRRGYRPILFTIEKSWGNKPFKIKPPPRHLLEGKDIWIAATPDGYMTDKELLDIVHKARLMSADQAEELLADNIRRVASVHPRKVGSHCLSTLLLPPNDLAPVRVRFSPSIPHKAVFTSQDNAIKQELPIAFSPWIITPNGYNSASTIVGNTEVNSGILNITIEAPKPDTGIVAYMGSLERPPAP